LALDVFLGYSPGPKGYHCLDLTSNKVIISRHVMFDESSFPLIESNSTPSSNFDFLSKFALAPLPHIGIHSIVGFFDNDSIVGTPPGRD